MPYIQRGLAIRPAFAGILLVLLLACPPCLAAENAGTVIASRDNAWAERGLKKDELFRQSPIFSGDILSTNAQGRLQVLFRDNSALMVAPDSRMAVSEYVYDDGGAPSMTLNIARGLTRMISGRIVEGQPGAMRVTTPQAKIGIHGTIAAVDVDPLLRLEKIYLLQISKGSFMAVSPLGGKTLKMNKAGTVLEIRSGKAEPIREIRSGEFAELAERLRAPSGYGAGTSQPGAKQEKSLMLAALNDNLHAASMLPNPALDLTARAFGAGSTPPVTPPVTPPWSSFSGTYTGSLAQSQATGLAAVKGPPWSGAFTVGIQDLGAAATVNSVHVTIVTPEWAGTQIAVNGAGDLGRLSSGGAFTVPSSNLATTLPGMSLYQPVSSSLSGQLAGNQMHLTVNTVQDGISSLTLTGSGTK